MNPTPLSPLDWDLGHVPPGMMWAGVDEAGRGAWAGPVVAAAALLDRPTIEKWRHVLGDVRDSKLLSPERRESLASELKGILPAWSVAEVDHWAIDRDNILEASLSAMRQAVRALKQTPRLLFVDGPHGPRTGLPERMLIDGDALSCAVGCASVLAKVHRDALMIRLDAVCPGYGFARHKGYGTKAHRAALAEKGASPWHRISYKPIAACQRLDESRFHALFASLERCTDHPALLAWVEQELRPAYGSLHLEWIARLRERYLERLTKRS